MTWNGNGSPAPIALLDELYVATLLAYLEEPCAP